MPAPEDQETRQRVLDAAERLFAERGYNNVTVRDICAAAEANVAAVNYYFHDKWGLYKELIQTLIQGAQRMQEAAHDSPPGTPPEKRLRHYIHTFLQHGLAPAEGEKQRWRGKLMGREMVDPTPGLDLIVEQVIRPNSEWVGSLIAELMGFPPSDWRVGACVGSVQTQMMGYFGPVVPKLAPKLKFTPEVIEGIADHITRFSLAGIRAIAKQKVEVKK
jgi:TetR/AcrR family transcriptional regulator, regulator of cefoperazone and chloramphenicol sensitivity